jgi:uncharacterized membrane protein YozB (DUF420 family)
LRLDLLIHPAIAITVVVLVAAAYLLKRGKRQFFTLHYAVAIAAFSLTFVAFPVALYEVAISGGASGFPPVISVHFLDFFAALSLLIVQGGLGMSMLVFGRRRSAYALHRRLGRYVLYIFILQGALGSILLYGVLPFAL